MSNSNKKEKRISSTLTLKQKSRLRKRARNTPWFSPDEFDHVGRCLSHAIRLFPVSSDVEQDNENIVPLDEQTYNELTYGIQRVSLWRRRTESGRLPHSVDMTCSIADVLLRDAHHQIELSLSPSESSMLSNSLKLAYASVIIRSVNGIADSMQKNRAMYGSSVSNLCSQIGLPLWIVDLRHDAAHNDLPSLIPLRLASKTLLGFFIEKYWNILEDMRIDWREEGVKLLVECKSACKALDRVQMELLKEDEDVTDAADDDDDDDMSGSGNYYGAYSIFMESKKNKNKEKAEPASKSAKNTPKKKLEGRTPRQCLNEFMKKIPIDMGLSMILQYLLYGGIGDAPDGRGILIPGSPSTFPETMNSVRKIRERYSPILFSVASQWPGFVHTLLVNIADLILSLEASNLAEAEEAGKTRKLYFLKYWVHYLLSNEFYCFLNWLDVNWKGSKNIRQRPREKWSEDLLSHMESSAPLVVLRGKVRLPLNNLCDRFVSEGEGEISKEIVALLEAILANDRVQGLLFREKNLKRPIDAISKQKDETDQEKGSPGKETDDNSVMMNLEEMEGMLSDDGEGEGKEEDQVLNMGKEEPETTGSDQISPWTLCESWEPCAIGTLPGFA